MSAKKLPKVEEVEDYGISRGNLCQNCKPMPISVCVVVVRSNACGKPGLIMLRPPVLYIVYHTIPRPEKNINHE